MNEGLLKLAATELGRRGGLARGKNQKAGAVPLTGAAVPKPTLCLHCARKAQDTFKSAMKLVYAMDKGAERLAASRLAHAARKAAMAAAWKASAREAWCCREPRKKKQI
jgi:hypothetical protein